jgi:hypothetical protein
MLGKSFYNALNPDSYFCRDFTYVMHTRKAAAQFRGRRVLRLIVATMQAGFRYPLRPDDDIFKAHLCSRSQRQLNPFTNSRHTFSLLNTIAGLTVLAVIGYVPFCVRHLCFHLCATDMADSWRQALNNYIQEIGRSNDLRVSELEPTGPGNNRTWTCIILCESSYFTRSFIVLIATVDQGTEAGRGTGSTKGQAKEMACRAAMQNMVPSRFAAYRQRLG